MDEEPLPPPAAGGAAADADARRPGAARPPATRTAMSETPLPVADPRPAAARRGARRRSSARGSCASSSHWPCVLGCAGAVRRSPCGLLVDADRHAARRGRTASRPRPSPGSAPATVDVCYSLAADPLTAIMLTAITFIGTLIADLLGRLHARRPGLPALLRRVSSLFVFSMTVLVLADNLLLLYAGWEGVGLCSYLLIGFWFTKPAAAAAARKAFLVTRIGDVGLILGIFLLWVSLGLQARLRRASSPPPRTADPVLLDRRVPAAVLRGGRQVGPVPAARLAARRDGRPDARVGPDPRGDDGDGRRLPRRPLHAAVPSRAGGAGDGRRHRRLHRPARRPDRADAERPQARPGLFDGQPARLHVPRPGQRAGGVWRSSP